MHTLWSVYGGSRVLSVKKVSWHTQILDMHIYSTIVLAYFVILCLS